MPEDTLLTYVQNGMRGVWEEPVKHADGYTAGIADLSAWLAPAGNIWLELKSLRAWPARAETPVVFEFDDLQRAFLRARRGWLLCRVVSEMEYLLFDHATAFTAVDRERATRGYLHGVATRVWIRSINWKEFATCLGKRYK